MLKDFEELEKFLKGFGYKKKEDNMAQAPKQAPGTGKPAQGQPQKPPVKK